MRLLTLNKRPASARVCLGFGLGFAEAGDAVAFLPLSAFLEQFDAFEAFENVALGAQSAGALQTTMLSHRIVKWVKKLQC